jgi:hypothetical protein
VQGRVPVPRPQVGEQVRLHLGSHLGQEGHLDQEAEGAVVFVQILGQVDLGEGVQDREPEADVRRVTPWEADSMVVARKALAQNYFPFFVS